MAITQLTEFGANELVSRANVNSRVTDVNSTIDTLTPVQLYYNASGTQSTVALSSSTANFSYIDIYYINDDGKDTYVRVANPNGKAVSLSMLAYWSSTMYMRAAVINISGSSITWDSDTLGWGTTARAGTSIYSGNLISITEVVGYKY